jgi:UDP-glucose 4-epimerase
MKKVLITGSSGFIGKHLMDYILDNNLAEVYGIDVLEGTNIFTHEAIPDIDVVFHLAGQTSVGNSIENPFFDATMNIMGTIQILKLYPEAKIIFAGSVASKDIQSPYGLSKKCAGEYIKLLAKDWTICNFPNVYGPNSKGVIDTWLNAKEIIVNGWGVQTRTFVNVLDICKALIMATEWKGEYDLGSGKETRIKDIAEAIAKKTGKKISYANEKQGEILNSLVFNTTPNWSPEVDIYNYIKKNGQR